MAASSSSAVHYPYDVFISHRGPDTKKTLASHLYRGLSKNGLKPFLDQPELQQGDSLTSQIEDVVRTASIHVAVLSPRYAESSWCLNELLLMLESGKTIIPVFYHVAPAELRWTRGKAGRYGEALQKLAEKRTYEGECRYDSNTIEKWRDALSKVGNISGFELNACNGDEGELVDQVVRFVVKKMKKPLHVAKYPVGLDDKVKDFENEVLLQQRQSEKPPVLGIVGLGGVGKTTLAKELFNIKSSNYSRSCFLSDVRECVNKGNLISLQKKLLKDLTGSDLEIGSIDENIETLKKHLSSSQIFVILDDVDHVDQVDSLLPDQSVVRSDSLIIITSRNKDILTSSGVENSSIYKLAGLNEQHSLELFCSHAFMQPYPLSQFEPFVDEFLEACQGLLLSLKVFGALLCGKKNPSYWQDQLDKLQRILPREIKQILQISFDALDVEEREIFLDVACFFIGEDRDMAVRIWDGSHWKGFQNLEDRCLVEVDSKNVIHMHDHLRDLGREIAKAPGLVCGTDHIDDLLQQPSHVITKLRGIRTVHTYGRSQMSWHRDILQIRASKAGLLERILTRVHSPNLIWLRWDECRYSSRPYSSLPSWIPVKNLRVLEVSGISLLEGEWQAPLQLRDLRISGLLGNLPNSIGHLTYLERISLSSVIQPREFMPLMRRFQLSKRLSSTFTKMKSLPDSFGNLSNLESMDLPYCVNLETLPKSFGNLTKLKYLSLKGCSKLTMSRETLGNISTLEHVSLAGCAKIEVLPMQLAHQRSLEKLDLSGTNIKELPNAIGELSNLEVLVVGSRSLDTLPPSLGALKNLKTLKLLHCQELKWLPASVGLLTQLTELAVWNCPISELPFKKVEGETATLRTSSNLDSSTENCMPRLQLLDLRNTEISDVSFVEGVCRNLEYLHISNSKDLVKVGTLPKTLVKLDLYSCRNLRKIEGLSGLARLKTLDIRECKEVEELPGIETLVALASLLANGCAKLKSIQRLVQLTKLRQLHIGGCSELEELPGVEHLRSLENFEAQNCVKLKNIRGLAQWAKLRELNVRGCSALEELPGVEHLRSLRVLKASKCVKLKSIQGLGQLTKLEDLDVSELEDLEGVEHLRSLEHLRASKCVKQGLGQLTKLWDLDVSECCELEDLEGVEHLRSLRVLRAYKCVKLKSIQGLGQLTKLQDLYVSECCELEDLEGVEHLRSLQHLLASKCVKLKSIQGLGQLTKLQYLNVSECCELEDLEGVEHLRSLQILQASKCVKLKTIKGLGQSTILGGLNVSECSELEDLEGVEHLRSLGYLEASKCVKLKSIKGLAQLTQLWRLDVSESSKLEGLEGIEHCMSLRALNASGCPKLQWGGGVVEQLHERLKEKLIL